MENDQVRNLVEKLLDIDEIKWNLVNLPAVMNAILSFASNKSNRPLILDAILTYFNQFYSNQVYEL